jgi:hypothetical protein
MAEIKWSQILHTDNGDRVTLTRSNGGKYSLSLVLKDASSSQYNGTGAEIDLEIDLSADDLAGLQEMFKPGGLK